MIHNSKKKLAQHFLTSKKIAERVTDAANIRATDSILEIGPGKGMLTDALIARCPKKIIAVEKDKKLVDFLKKKYSAKDPLRRSEDEASGSAPGGKNEKRIEIIEGDIRTIFNRASTRKKLGKQFKVVANIPYYLTSYLIRLLLKNGLTKPKSIVFMIQKEVAKRIIARPPNMNLLALSIQSMGEARIAFFVTKKYFSPQPKVDSAVIIIEHISDAFFKKIEKEKFFGLLHYGFGNKRKMLLPNLSKKIPTPKNELEKIFAHCNIHIQARAENLSLEQWKCLFLKIQSSKFKAQNLK
ncbi:MAG: 16S rRNA (adenine(1518)-N(6)/adenine(1519)-N(6))-dimethyltransferase RsmA [bacterium]|nr:16S rRNA (adenine(1518)-N(6)/adenine(1519)-N(6))-dimethyltransferase RsmA [bacterium]